MGNAFECDRCEDLYPGKPQRFMLRQYHSVTLSGWTDSHSKFSAELCEECSEELERYAAVLFGAEDSYVPPLEELFADIDGAE